MLHNLLACPQGLKLSKLVLAAVPWLRPLLARSSTVHKHTAHAGAPSGGVVAVAEPRNGGRGRGAWQRVGWGWLEYRWCDVVRSIGSTPGGVAMWGLQARAGPPPQLGWSGARRSLQATPSPRPSTSTDAVPSLSRASMSSPVQRACAKELCPSKPATCGANPFGCHSVKCLPRLEHGNSAL